jgi:ribonuclease P/MRP protein subunit POP8
MFVLFLANSYGFRITQSGPGSGLDALTARTHLTAALSQFLGLAGTAISVDILKIESTPLKRRDADHDGRGGVYLWIRVPREDASAVVAAVSSWIGGESSGAEVAWRVCSKGNYLGGLVFGSGGDLF